MFAKEHFVKMIICFLRYIHWDLWSSNLFIFPFRCVCTHGLLIDNKRCNTSQDFLFFAKRNEIIQLSLDPQKKSNWKKISDSLNNAIGVDFDYKGGRIFYSDIYLKEIGSISVDNSSDKTILVKGIKLDFNDFTPSYLVYYDLL